MKKGSELWGSLKNFMEKSHKKIEQSFDTVMNAIDGVEYREQLTAKPEPQKEPS